MTCEIIDLATIDEHERVLLESFFDGLRPIPRLTVSQWGNMYRMLTSASSAEPGPYRFERTPYLRQIMDDLGITSDMREIFVMKGAQLGFTDAGNNWIGYVMHISPGPMLLIMPTEAALKKNSRTRIEPMIEGTPVLKERTGKKGEKGTVNTILEKEFPGGFLMMVAAQSPVGLSSTPVGFIMADEVDRYPASAGKEGSPVELARARQRTFSNRKLYGLSTPTIEGESIIEAEFKTGNCQYYFVPCLHCNELFRITWDCLTWSEGRPETVRCACPTCGGLHEERHKTKMFAEEGFSVDGRAKWIPTRVSDDPKKVSYHLSSLYSPAGMFSWEDAVRQFLKIENDRNKEIAFINTVLGETYKIKGEAPDFENLYNRREDYQVGTVPDPVAFLTIGADVQPDRIEYEVVGWCPGRTTYSVDYRVILGDTSKGEVWSAFREVINGVFPVSEGIVMPVRLTCVDAGFNTKKVYDFTDTFPAGKVIPIMGRDNIKDAMVAPPRAINIAKNGKKIKAKKVWHISTGVIKSEIYGYLGLRATELDGVESYPLGYCHFPEYDRHYFKMLTAEELRLTQDKKGYGTYEWVKKFERNEALDCRVYARAAAYIVGIDTWKPEKWEAAHQSSRMVYIDPEKQEEVSRPPAATKKKKGGGFWDRGKR